MHPEGSHPRPYQWLLDADEPWRRYRALIDLLAQDPQDPRALAAREEMLTYPLVRGLVAKATDWESCPVKRHNDAGHPLAILSTLADFGLGCRDPGITGLVESILVHQSPEGAF